jgi:GNAT superfamily N-acetyltransferase
MSEPIAIRPAALADSPCLALLCGQLGYPASPPQVHQRLAAILNDPARAVFVATSSSGEVVGWIQVSIVRLLMADAYVEVDGLVVDESHRRAGVGQALMVCAESWARQHGLQDVCLHSNIIRQEAHRFYEHLGYASAKTQLNFRKRLSGE